MIEPLPPAFPGGVAFFAFLVAASPGSDLASGETTAGPMSCVSPPGVPPAILASFWAGAAPFVGARGSPFVSRLHPVLPLEGCQMFHRQFSLVQC